MVIYVNVDNCRFGFFPVYAAVAGFVILASVYLTLCGCLCACMCILSTVNVKLILGTFTGYIMASSYYIVFRSIAL